MDTAWTAITKLLRVSHTLEAQVEAVLHSYGFGFTDLRLMVIISHLDGAPQKTLAAKMGLSQVVISTRLDRLERAGLVTRPHAGHRRVAVRLTERGAALLEVLLQALEHSAPSRAMARLIAEDGSALIEALDSVLQAMSVPAGFPGQTLLKVSTGTPPDLMKRWIESTRSALEQALREEDYRMTAEVHRLTDELDTLVSAYMALRSQVGNGSRRS